MKKDAKKRAEIATILLVGGVLFLGVLSMVSSIFVRDSTNSLAYQPEARVMMGTGDASVSESSSNGPQPTSKVSPATGNGTSRNSTDQRPPANYKVTPEVSAPAEGCGIHKEGDQWCYAKSLMTCKNGIIDTKHTCSGIDDPVCQPQNGWICDTKELMPASPTPQAGCGTHHEGDNWCELNSYRTCKNDHIDIVTCLGTTDPVCAAGSGWKCGIPGLTMPALTPQPTPIDTGAVCKNIGVGNQICVDDKRYMLCTQYGTTTLFCPDNWHCVGDHCVSLSNPPGAEAGQGPKENLKPPPSEKAVPQPVATDTPVPTPVAPVTLPDEKIFMCTEQKTISTLNTAGDWVTSCQCRTKSNIIVITEGACK